MTGTMWLAHCRTCFANHLCTIIMSTTCDDEAAKWNLGKRELATGSCIVCGTHNCGAARRDEEFFLFAMNGEEDDKDDVSQ